MNQKGATQKQDGVEHKTKCGCSSQGGELCRKEADTPWEDECFKWTEDLLRKADLRGKNEPETKMTNKKQNWSSNFLHQAHGNMTSQLFCFCLEGILLYDLQGPVDLAPGGSPTPAL